MAHDLKEGDEAYMIDCVLRPGVISKRFDSEELDFATLWPDADANIFRTVGTYERSITSMIEYLHGLLLKVNT